MYYIGVDGGGTKTKFVLYDEEGRILHDVSMPTCHILQVSDEVCVQILKDGLHNVMQDFSYISSDDMLIVAGLAGYGREEALRNRLIKNCKQAFYPYHHLLYNDVQTAITGALNGDDGIVVIAGTGSIALSICSDVEKRCGGWGYSLGDEGSAYWLAKKMLEVFCKQADGRLPKTLLYDLIMQTYHLQHDFDLISFVNQTLKQSREGIASMAIVLYQAVKQKDEHALRLYDDAAKELVMMIHVLQKDFQDEVKVSYIGGVFKSGEYILKPLQSFMNHMAVLCAPAFPPEYGAYLLGKKYHTKKQLSK